MIGQYPAGVVVVVFVVVVFVVVVIGVVVVVQIAVFALLSESSVL